jgi:hypothetical protein
MENINPDLILMDGPTKAELIEVERIAINPLYDILLNKHYTTPVGKNDYISAYT